VTGLDQLLRARRQLLRARRQLLDAVDDARAVLQRQQLEQAQRDLVDELLAVVVDVEVELPRRGLQALV
jgi:hypothetical protein